MVYSVSSSPQDLSFQNSTTVSPNREVHSWDHSVQSLVGTTDSGVNFLDNVLDFLGLSNSKKEKMFDWQARREWALNRAYELSKYDWQKRGLINAGINPLIAMSSSAGSPTINRSSSNSNSSGGILELISGVLKALLGS